MNTNRLLRYAITPPEPAPVDPSPANPVQPEIQPPAPVHPERPIQPTDPVEPTTPQAFG
ncbi:MAG TPA: hypothetical protein VLC79_11300 [Cellvibrio sp.]|nr:hypothetical protein [Cellvibrio sp.]